MEILVVDTTEELLNALESRVDEAIKQSGLRRVRLQSCMVDVIEDVSLKFVPEAVLVGPGCFEDCEDVVERVQIRFPRSGVGVVLQNDIYALEAVRLRRVLGVKVMPIADIANIASFVLDNQQITKASGSTNDGVIAVAQMKGGVGSSTLTASLAACWADHELSVCILDLDDINPHLTDWARVSVGKRSLVSELLRQGQVPVYRLSECMASVEGSERSISIIGQPANYHESFHFKADVLEGAPSSQAFIESVVPLLQDNFDIVLVDLGRSWGVSHFATLPLCQQVVLVVDDDALTLKRSIDSLRRLTRESDDANEFDFSKWRMVMNGYSSRLLEPSDVSDECDDSGLFPESMSLHTIQFSEKGRKWGAPGKTFYDLAEEHIRSGIKDLCQEIIPFKRGERKRASRGFFGKLKQAVGFR